VRTFEYLKPTSIPGVLDLLERHGEEAKLIAGGTDVMVQWKKRIISPRYLISVRNVSELQKLSANGGLSIGSAVTHRTLELDRGIRSTFPIITDAVANLGSVQVRNSATMGGNICNAAPSADTAPPMLVLEADVHVKGPGGDRTIALAEFFQGPSRTVLKPNECVTHFSVSQLLPRTGAAYWKLSRRKAMDLPILGVAMLLSLEEDMHTCTKARVALGVAGPTPRRAPQTEAFLEGKPVDEEVLREAGKIAAQEASPRTTIRGSEWYRRNMIEVLVRRTGGICLERAKGVAQP
jgi:carbon-monoxide dehydrogenase medium subunit